MKVIKEGKPYRIHKCSKCKTVYAYEYDGSGWTFVRCPKCDDYLDMHYFDKKISKEKYDKLGG